MTCPFAAVLLTNSLTCLDLGHILEAGVSRIGTLLVAAWELEVNNVASIGGPYDT